MWGCRELRQKFRLLLIPMMAWGQVPLPQTPVPKKDLDSCRIREVTSLPGSHHFASDFIVTMASDPDPKARDTNTVWGLTADLAEETPVPDRAMYIAKSTN